MILSSLLIERLSDDEELRCGLSLYAVKGDYAAQRAARILLSFGGENTTQLPTSRYEPYLERCFASRSPAVQDLVDFLFQQNSVKALELVLEFEEEPEERRKELLAANAIAAKYYPQTYGVVRVDAEPSPEELAGFLDAMQGDEWWLPLYFAEIVRKVYSFQTEEVVNQLRAMDHPIVQEALKAMAIQDPADYVPLSRMSTFAKYGNEPVAAGGAE
ncbi:MAG: hypothetical protein AMXMBFR82_53870 [Candidatus Hydrogenedentota bacterium]